MTGQIFVVTSKDRDCHTRAVKYDVASHSEERDFASWEELSALARSMRSNVRGVSSRDAVERFPSGCERRAEMILIPDRVLLARNNGRGSVLDGERRTNSGRETTCALMTAKVISTALDDVRRYLHETNSSLLCTTSVDSLKPRLLQ